MSASTEPLRAIVTGGAGALGKAVVAALETRGDRVICLDRIAPDSGEHRILDLTDPDATRDAMASACGALGGSTSSSTPPASSRPPRSSR